MCVILATAAATADDDDHDDDDDDEEDNVDEARGPLLKAASSVSSKANCAAVKGELLMPACLIQSSVYGSAWLSFTRGWVIAA